MAFNGGSNDEARRQQATKTTARIELKWQTANGGRHTVVLAVVDITAVARQPLSSSVVDNVFNGGGMPPSSDRGPCRHSLVVSLPPSSGRRRRRRRRSRVGQQR